MASVSQQMLLADGGGVVTLPSVVQRVSGNLTARATSSVLTWAATSAGNLIVIEITCETNAAAPSTPAGYSAWPSGNLANGGNLTTNIFYKVATAGETGVTISHGSNVTAWVMREFVAPASTIEFGTPVIATTATPDPPTVTPAAGSNTYAFVAGASYPTVAVSAYSAGYTNGLEAASFPTVVKNASADKTAVAASDNPGTMTVSASVKTIAFTYAVS
jgi:hypothetical protein